MPTLLTRRDELFPLARQVVRESGYQYSKGHSRSQFSQTGFPSKLFGTNVNIAGTPGTPPGANGEREHPSPLASTVGKIEGKQPRKRQRISDNDFLQQKRRVSTYHPYLVPDSDGLPSGVKKQQFQAQITSIITSIS